MGEKKSPTKPPSYGGKSGTIVKQGQTQGSGKYGQNPPKAGK